MDWNSSTYAPKEILPRWLRSGQQLQWWILTFAVLDPRERHVLTQLCLLTGECLATVLTKVTINQILSQTTFQALIPGLPAWPCALFQYVILCNSSFWLRPHQRLVLLHSTWFLVLILLSPRWDLLQSLLFPMWVNIQLVRYPSQGLLPIATASYLLKSCP